MNTPSAPSAFWLYHPFSESEFLAVPDVSSFRYVSLISFQAGSVEGNLGISCRRYLLFSFPD
ncbi:hypothetical protein CAL7102_01783 [Dulcicalothrix desertica PCC 7102]|nr:hypothetical protein CAL7102_01783 [Dulcicalothrix desertica PCC 7102]